MSYLHLAFLHLATVVPAFFIGGYLLWARKGTPRHRRLGRARVRRHGADRGRRADLAGREVLPGEPLANIPARPDRYGGRRGSRVSPRSAPN